MHTVSIMTEKIYTTDHNENTKKYDTGLKTRRKGSLKIIGGNNLKLS